MKEMMKALVSDKAMQETNEEISNRSWAPYYEIGGLAFTDMGGRLSAREEAYMSSLADKIPGVVHSERAYVTFLNVMRADLFDSMANLSTRDGKLSRNQAKVIANYVNTVTGRGITGGRLANALASMNFAFFSPRLFMSRVQYLIGQPLWGGPWKGTAHVRAQIAKEYAKVLGLFTAVMFAAGLLPDDDKDAKVSISTDPYSSDFMKIKVGKTRIDWMAGLQQPLVFASREIMGKKTTASGLEYSIRGDDVPYGKDDAWDVLATFARTKLSPVVSTGVNIASGKNVVGEPTTPMSILKGLAVPLAWQDTHEAMQEYGVPAGIALGVLAAVGIGVQTYGGIGVQTYGTRAKKARGSRSRTTRRSLR